VAEHKKILGGTGKLNVLRGCRGLERGTIDMGGREEHQRRIR